MRNTGWYRGEHFCQEPDLLRTDRIVLDLEAWYPCIYRLKPLPQTVPDSCRRDRFPITDMWCHTPASILFSYGSYWRIPKVSYRFRFGYAARCLKWYRFSDCKNAGYGVETEHADSLQHVYCRKAVFKWLLPVAVSDLVWAGKTPWNGAERAKCIPETNFWLPVRAAINRLYKGAAINSGHMPRFHSRDYDAFRTGEIPRRPCI